MVEEKRRALKMGREAGPMLFLCQRAHLLVNCVSFSFVPLFRGSAYVPACMPYQFFLQHGTAAVTYPMLMRVVIELHMYVCEKRCDLRAPCNGCHIDDTSQQQ